MGDTLKITSFNVRGLGDKLKRNSIFEFLKKKHKGVVFLQETHTNKNSERLWKSEWQGQIFFSHGTSTKCGVAILLPRKFDMKINSVRADTNGRYLLLDIHVNDTNYTLLNVYAPTKDHPKEQAAFLEEVNNLLQNSFDHPLILAGDFNITLNPTLDKHGGRIEKATDYTKSLLDFIDEYDLNDIWRIRNPDAKRYTRRQNTRSGIVHSRIDFFLTSVSLAYNITDTNIEAGLFSDHSIIQIQIRIAKNTKEILQEEEHFLVVSQQNFINSSGAI